MSKNNNEGTFPVGVGAKRQEYNVSELEISIDRLRQLRDWPAVSSLIKRYAHVFDIGCASEGGTNFRGERSRSYYWVVMAEVMIHQNKDMQNAGFCITRAAERDPDFGLWRVILVKILLMRTKKLSNHDSTMKSTSGDSDSEFFPLKGKKDKEDKGSKHNYSGGIQTDSYDKAIKELDHQERNLIVSSLDSFKMIHSNAILSAFSALPSDEILRIFMEILVRFNQLEVNHQDVQARAQWIYSICKKVLQNIHITDYYQQYKDKHLSEYHFWLVLDAICTRSLIREICGDMQQARSDIQQLIHVVVKQHDLALSTLPEAIRTSLLFTCCRLPILERNMNLSSASLNSFRFCVSGDSLIAPHLTTSVKIALSMTAADMMIQLAYSVHQNQQQTFVAKNTKEHSTDDAQKEHAASRNDSIENIINHAYMLLVDAKDMLVTTTSSASLSTTSTSTGSDGGGTDLMTHHPSSLIYDLKYRLGFDYSQKCRSDPMSLFETSPSGAIATEHVGILLASITRFLKGKRSNMEDPLEVLTWALSVSAKPSYDLLWNVSQIYLSPRINKLSESVSLMQQCIARKAATINAEEVRTIFDRSELSTWLGLGVQIHKYTALPALKCGHTCLYGLGNPKKAITVAMQGLHQCTGLGGRECAALVRRKLASFDATLTPVTVSPAPRHQSFLTLSLMSTLGSTAVNIFQFVLIIAKSFAVLSRCDHAGHKQVQQWIHKSCLMFDLLESTELRDLFDQLPVSDQDDWSFEDLFYEKCRHQAFSSSVFDYSGLLAEKGEIDSAIKRMRSFLSEIDAYGKHCDISNHLHLLAVLVHTKDNPQSQQEAVTLCERAIEIKSTLSSSLYVANIQLTLAYLYQRQSKVEESVALVDQIFHIVKCKDMSSGPMKLYKFLVDFPFQQELVKVSLLVECCVLCRNMNRLDKAQQCLEEAWLILYSPTLMNSLFPISGATNKNESQFSAGEHTSEPVKQPYLKEAHWISSCRDIPILPGISACSNACVYIFIHLGYLFYTLIVVSLQGWKLPSGMGWGVTEVFERGVGGKSPDDGEEFSITRTNYSSLEADLLAECANVVFWRLRNNIIHAQDSAITYESVQDILSLALSVHPGHLGSTLLMATVSVTAIEEKDPTDRNLVDIVRANDYAQAALRVNKSQAANAWWVIFVFLVH